MIEIFNKDTGQRIGELTENQFDFLMYNIENEYLEKINYVIDAQVVELLKGRGADFRILDLLGNAIKGKKSISIAYHIPEEAEFDYNEEEEEEEL